VASTPRGKIVYIGISPHPTEAGTIVVVVVDVVVLSPSYVIVLLTMTIFWEQISNMRFCQAIQTKWDK